MLLALAAAIAIQMPPEDFAWIRADLAAAWATEEFVLSARPHANPPEPFRGLMVRMGNPGWRTRDAASKEMASASRDDQRWLFWGRHHRDPEVRLRCNAIIRRLNPCPTCKGTGASKNWDAWPCWDCGGTRTCWTYAAFD